MFPFNAHVEQLYSLSSTAADECLIVELYDETSEQITTALTCSPGFVIGARRFTDVLVEDGDIEFDFDPVVDHTVTGTSPRDIAVTNMRQLLYTSLYRNLCGGTPTSEITDLLMGRDRLLDADSVIGVQAARAIPVAFVNDRLKSPQAAKLQGLLINQMPARASSST